MFSIRCNSRVKSLLSHKKVCENKDFCNAIMRSEDANIIRI